MTADDRRRARGAVRAPLRAAGLALALAAGLGSLAACEGPWGGVTGSAGSALADEQVAAADAVAPHAGSYPVATPEPANTTAPQVSAGGYQLVSAGESVTVHLPSGEGSVLASGPDVTLPDVAVGQPIAGSSAPGVLTVTATATSGSLTLDRSAFLGLDEDQDQFSLGTGPSSVTATPGHPATLQLRSVFPEGHTTATWQPLGKPLVTWDFVVEID